MFVLEHFLFVHSLSVSFTPAAIALVAPLWFYLYVGKVCFEMWSTRACPAGCGSCQFQTWWSPRVFKLGCLLRPVNTLNLKSSLGTWSVNRNRSAEPSRPPKFLFSLHTGAFGSRCTAFRTPYPPTRCEKGGLDKDAYRQWRQWKNDLNIPQRHPLGLIWWRALYRAGGCIWSWARGL